MLQKRFQTQSHRSKNNIEEERYLRFKRIARDSSENQSQREIGFLISCKFLSKLEFVVKC